MRRAAEFLTRDSLVSSIRGLIPSQLRYRETSSPQRSTETPQLARARDNRG